jgi:hypothetical protein
VEVRSWDLAPEDMRAGVDLALSLARRRVALVRAGAKFQKGVLIERLNEQDQEAAA